MVILDISPMCDHSLQLETWTGHRGMHRLNTSSLPYIEMLRGRDGRDRQDGVPSPCGPQGQRGNTGATGAQGPPGPRSGGVVYTRWGKTTCPNVSELSWCMQRGLVEPITLTREEQPTTSDPDYLCYHSGVQGYSDVFGVEYQPYNGPLSAIHENYASTRVAVTMIPAKPRCPLTWTLDYSGLLWLPHVSSKPLCSPIPHHV